MASTSQMVEWIIMNADGWDRAGQRAVLPVLNQVHKILLQNETHQSLKFDSLIGEFPYIPTIDGVFEYNAPPDVWRIGEVLIPYPLARDYGFEAYAADYGNYRRTPNVETKVYFNKYYVKLPNVQTVDKPEGGFAKIRFHDNPGAQISPLSEGTNTAIASAGNTLVDGTATFITDGVVAGHGVTNEDDKLIAVVQTVNSETSITLDRSRVFLATGKSYKVGTSTILYKGYVMPPNLTSEAVNMGGNDKFHMEVLLPATLEYIEAFENGGWRNAFEVVTNKYKPMMIDEENKGEQGLTFRTTPREI